MDANRDKQQQNHAIPNEIGSTTIAYEILLRNVAPECHHIPWDADTKEHPQLMVFYLEFSSKISLTKIGKYEKLGSRQSLQLLWSNRLKLTECSLLYFQKWWTSSI